MEKHTPGPYYTQKTGNHQRIIASEETGESIAVVYDAKNAPLLEAAPDLLYHIKDLLYYLQRTIGRSPELGTLGVEHAIYEARNTLKKSKGEE